MDIEKKTRHTYISLVGNTLFTARGILFPQDYAAPIHPRQGGKRLKLTESEAAGFGGKIMRLYDE